MENDKPAQETPEITETAEITETTEITEKPSTQPGDQKSKYSDYVTKDGRTWDQLDAEERKKIRKKLNKKNKKKNAKVAENAVDGKAKVVAKQDFSVAAQIKWCTSQIRLGLNSNAVTKDQCKQSSFEVVFDFLVKESLKVIGILENPDVKKVKKISTMRSSFGNVKKLMKENPLPVL